MLFLFTFLLLMTLPGAALTFLIGLTPCRVVFSIALSFGILVIVLALARTVELRLEGFELLLVAVYGTIGVVTAMMWWFRKRNRAVQTPVRVKGVWIIPIMGLSAVTGYIWWAGPYTEIPADAWWHIDRINEQLSRAVDGEIGSIRTFNDLFEKYWGYWYTIVAIIMFWAGLNLSDGLTLLTLGSTLLFCGGVYAFTLYALEGIVKDHWVRHWVALGSVFFFITHFGISVFSYVRYYAFAPTILNYIVYLAGVVCVIHFLRTHKGGYRYAATAIVLTALAAMVHLQEAVFIIVMSVAIMLVESARLYRSGISPFAATDIVGWDGRRRAFFIFTLTVIAYLVIHTWAYNSLPRNNPLAHGVMSDIRAYLPFIQNLYILKPTGQFYEVVTVWGILVYVLFFFRLKEFSESPYLMAGMAIPALTVFNPVFTDFFLRFSWPEVLWRMCYMIPLPILGGYFLVRSITMSFRAGHMAVRGGWLLALIALLLLLLPIKTTYFVSPYSKLYTVSPVSKRNDHRNWTDLIDFLEQRDATRLLTDPVTGYVVTALTHHYYAGYKFYGKRAMKLNRESYSDEDFHRWQGRLMVVNRRDGGLSKTGLYGGHWPQDIMKVSQQYSESFERYLDRRSEIFKPIWQRDNIVVYEIQEFGEGSEEEPGKG